MERLDLKICHDLYESTWIEIKNKHSKNIICGSIYRHPNHNTLSYDKFLEYMDMCLSKITNENKEVYICGDKRFMNLCAVTDYYHRYFSLQESKVILQQ